MAKILVADDNSNVHKTVALALADLEIEVIAVNNGEAAVRKLSELSPDLVLADIFMPVRSGYEVCEFVKKNPRSAQIPVVLLVGAFDPLDEREAQRVGADGILKKPFVPPDPLITMVKSLLHRVLGERLAAMNTTNESAAVLATVGPAANSGARASSLETSVEPKAQEFPAPAAHVAFGEDEPPVAFSQFLETPSSTQPVSSETAVIEPVDDEQVLTSRRDATLGDPIFWKNDEPEEEAEEEEMLETSSKNEERSWAEPKESAPLVDETEVLQPIEPLELVTEEHDDSAPSIVDSERIKLDPADQTPLTVESGVAPDLAANPIEWLATAPTELPGEKTEDAPEWAESISDAAPTVDSVEDLDPPAVTPAVLPPVSTKPAEPVVDKTPVSVAVTPVPVEPPAPILQKAQTTPNPLDQSAADTARSIPRQDWADLTAALRLDARELATHEIKAMSKSPAQVPSAPAGGHQEATERNAEDASPDPALIEAVVSRVLEKMRPQVVDTITKEFLRPIVETLVNREIKKQ